MKPLDRADFSIGLPNYTLERHANRCCEVVSGVRIQRLGYDRGSNFLVVVDGYGDAEQNRKDNRSDNLPSLGGVSVLGTDEDAKRDFALV